jgi:ELWxxDGT repeat protein
MLGSLLLFSFLQIQAQPLLLNNNDGLELRAQLSSQTAIFFSNKTRQLWVTDGTTAGTRPLHVAPTFEAHGAVINGVMYFRGRTAAHGSELWATDGTEAGTRLVLDIEPGAASSAPSDRFVVLNNTLYFSAFRTGQGREIWKSDGTAAGTSLLLDIVPGAGSSNGESMFKLFTDGRLLYFVAGTAATGPELWRSDGTAAGTFLLKDIYAGANSSVPMMLGTYNGELVFAAEDAEAGAEPWLTNGTVAGTRRLADIAPGATSSSPDQLAVLNGQLLFTAFHPATGQELYISNGTTAGTRLIKDIYGGSPSAMPNLVNGISINGQFIFSAYSEATGLELWRTDGTAAGTQLFYDAFAGGADGFPFIFNTQHYAQPNGGLFKGQLFFFSAFSATHGFEVHVSDGTPAGTRVLKDINPGFNDGLIDLKWLYTNSHFYFCAYHPGTGQELWRTDGTTAGTALFADLNTQPGMGSDPLPATVANNHLLIEANDGDVANSTYNDLLSIAGIEQPLPARLLQFGGRRTAQGALLQWQIAQPQGLQQFEVLRSTDGQRFELAGTLAYVHGRLQYEWTDAAAAGKPVLYYQLRMKDLDGKTKLSQVLVLPVLDGTGIKAVAAGSWIKLQYKLPASNASIRIHDAAGRLLHQAVLPYTEGSWQWQPGKAGAGQQVLYISVHSGAQRFQQALFF